LQDPDLKKESVRLKKLGAAGVNRYDHAVKWAYAYSKFFEGNMTVFWVWVWRLLLANMLINVYSLLPEPLDNGFVILIGLVLLIGIYNRASARFNLWFVPLKIERAELVKLAHFRGRW
jgi:hypothetical protein